MQWYAGRELDERRDVWLLMSERFAPDLQKVSSARDRHGAAMGTPDEAQAEVHLRRALVSPRARLLQRFAIDPDGMRFLVDLRAELLPHLKGDRRLLPLDAELEHLFSTWFDVAFLDLRRISWDSPASLIEKLIQYEAVHDIKSWADVKNRLDSDRRCYGFFHPRLPNDAADLRRGGAGRSCQRRHHAAARRGRGGGQARPRDDRDLLFDQQHPERPARRELRRFADQARGRDAAGGIAAPQDLRHAVADPGLSCLARQECGRPARAGSTRSAPPSWAAWSGSLPPTAERLLAAADEASALDAKSPVRQVLLQFAAEYLGRATADGKPVDPVARFHLGNGARVERLNWAGDPSPKGLKQSYGLMVNYLYDLKRLDKHRALLAQGKVAVSGEIDDLFLKA